MAFILSNTTTTSLLLDPLHVSTSRTSKPRVLLSDILLHKERLVITRSSSVHVRAKSKNGNLLDYENNSSDDENGNGVEDDGLEENNDGFDWEMDMRRRVKEIQEMRELEKKADELLSRDDGDGDEGRDESEEEKRLRVRKELQKVAQEQE
ncbi:hypothetical protein Leryth_018696 [Lithospermum erythrorhizon]|nr:hypothetical protein Leryth_018696 [Lithospermum erythrorhizon]